MAQGNLAGYGISVHKSEEIQGAVERLSAARII